MSTAPHTTTPAIELDPVIARLMAFPHDPISSSELAGILGMSRAAVSDAFKDGVIANHGSCLRRKGKATHARRASSKAAVIEWLWDSRQGERTMLRAALQQHAPRVLATLDKRDSANALKALPKPKSALLTEARPMAQLLLFEAAAS